MIPIILLLFGITWEEQLIQEINVYREDANLRELAIYGYIEQERVPLKHNLTLDESGKWWARALRGTDLMVHGWYVNENGYLVNGGKILSKVWLPSDMGWTDFNIRNAYLGLYGWQSENGYFGKSTDPKVVCMTWATNGWNDDPRLVRGGHYSNMISPYWDEAGVAKNAWGNGKSSVWLEVFNRTQP